GRLWGRPRPPPPPRPGARVAGVPARPDNAAVSSDPRRLREVLDAAGYAEPTVLAALGLPRLPDARRLERRMLLHRTRGGSPLETLVRLLLLGEASCSCDASRTAAPPGSAPRRR